MARNKRLRWAVFRSQLAATAAFEIRVISGAAFIVFPAPLFGHTLTLGGMIVRSTQPLCMPNWVRDDIAALRPLNRATLDTALSDGPITRDHRIAFGAYPRTPLRRLRAGSSGDDALHISTGSEAEAMAHCHAAQPRPASSCQLFTNNRCYQRSPGPRRAGARASGGAGGSDARAHPATVANPVPRPYTCAEPNRGPKCWRENAFF